MRRSDSAVLSAVCPPMVGSSASRPLLLDDLGDDLRRDRLDIGGVGQIRVGHDRRRIGVDQDDPVALLLERLAGLGAGIVELAGLADDDRAGADDQDRWRCRFVWACWLTVSVRAAQKKGALPRVLAAGADVSPARGRSLDQNRRAGKGYNR